AAPRRDGKAAPSRAARGALARPGQRLRRAVAMRAPACSKRRRPDMPKSKAERDTPPRLAFIADGDVPWTEVIAQMHGERRVSVHEKFLEWNDRRMVVLGRYDPGVVIERHGHASDHLVYVLEGELLVGDRLCPRGTLIVLELGAKFGPLIAGASGA